MIFAPEMLQIMLGQSSGSEEFGECIASFCKDNLEMTKQIANVFLTNLSQTQAIEKVKNYL